MAFDKNLEQIASKVLGRPVRSAEERRFIMSVSKRKPDPQAFQGALEYQQKQGAFASSNAEANTGRPDLEPQTPTMSTIKTSSPTDTSDLMLSAIGDIREKAKGVEELREKLLMEDERRRIRTAILSEPEFRRLSELKAGLRRDVQERDTSIEGKEGITDPAQAARLSLSERGDIAESASLLADTMSRRELGVRETVESIGKLREQEYEQAQLALENSRDYLSDILTVRADERAQLTSDLQAQKLRQDMAGGVISKEKLAEWALEFGPQALSELNLVTGLPSTAPFVQGFTGFGYQNGDETFYNTRHKGIDIMAPENSPIQASVPLTITNVYNDEKGGLIVEGTDSEGATHKFMHLNQALVNVGDQVNAGEMFALSGNTGTLTTGPHVHYEINQNGQNVDPRAYALPGQSTFVSRREQEQMTANAKGEDDLRTEYLKQAAVFINTQQSYSRIVESAKQSEVSPESRGAADLALIFNYMKVLDPGSAVRETEFANAQNAAGIPERVRAMYNDLVRGGTLSAKQRADFVERAKFLYEGQQKLNQQVQDYYKGLASQRGLNPDNVVIPFQQFITDQANQPSLEEGDFVSGWEQQLLPNIPPAY